MKGIVIVGLDTDFPSVSIDAGTIQKEDLWRYSKRNAQGLMRRIGWIGYTLRIEMKWGLLKADQYAALIKVITNESFKIQFPWTGISQTVTNIQREFYAGNVSATPFKLKKDSEGKITNIPTYYKDVSFPAILLGVLK